MSFSLTQRQKDLLDFLKAYIAEHGIAPSFEQMKEALSLKSKSGVHRLISALEERGLIRRGRNRARCIEINSTDPLLTVPTNAEELDTEAIIMGTRNLLRAHWHHHRGIMLVAHAKGRQVVKP